MVTVEELLRISIFNNFSRESLADLVPGLVERTFPAGTTIIHRGDPGCSMFLIVRGTVAVTRRNDEDVEYTLATLGEGDIFGEMALMTGEPRSASVKALSEVLLYELCQEPFYALVAAHPQMNESLLRMLVQRRGRNVLQQTENLDQDGMVATLFGQHPPGIDRLAGKTQWTVETNRAIDRLAAGSGHLLIIGEKGSGKNLSAQLVHFRGPGKEMALFCLDCAAPPPSGVNPQVRRKMRSIWRSLRNRRSSVTEPTQAAMPGGSGGDIWNSAGGAPSFWKTSTFSPRRCSESLFSTCEERPAASPAESD